MESHVTTAGPVHDWPDGPPPFGRESRVSGTCDVPARPSDGAY